MTSNLGSQQIQKMAPDNDYVAMKNAVMEVVSEHFRPEFVNRVDDMVVFHPLDRDQIRQIVDIQLASLHARLQDRDIAIEVAPEAMDLLAEAGFDPVYGARPLKRAIQQRLENPLAEALLAGDFVAGDIIKVAVDADGLIFSRDT